jgi:hypothetical protein
MVPLFYLVTAYNYMKNTNVKREMIFITPPLIFKLYYTSSVKSTLVFVKKYFTFTVSIFRDIYCRGLYLAL